MNDRRRPWEAGTTTVEGLGVLIFALLLFMAAVQASGWGYALILTSHAAREGAREASLGGDGRAAALNALPAGWRDRAEVEVEKDGVRVALEVPAAFVGPSLTASSRAGYVLEPHAGRGSS